MLNPSALEVVNPIAFDEVIASYQHDFAAIAWNQKSFGRAYEQPDAEGDLRTPKIYQGNGEYYDVLPNDMLNAFSFLMARSEERRTDEDGLERDVSAVFWLNLQEARPGIDEVTVEPLRLNVLKVIKDNPYTMSIERYFDERHEDVFMGYISGDRLRSNKYLMYPFSGFRIDFIVGYPFPC